MNTNAQSAVAVRELNITYGNVTVIRNLSLDIAPREFLVLLGPSGCGKSTLLNAIAGLNDIADGEIWISGRNVTWAEPKDRGIGMVFQSYALYPRMTVEDNLTFGLRVAGLPKDEIARRLQRAAKLLHLEPLLRRKPAELSGGQRQRVAIGRALVREGMIQQLAPPAEIYHRPSNLFVAGFIGSPGMNFIPGQIKAGVDGRLEFRGAGLALPLSDLGVTATAAAGDATLGIRPEHIIPQPNAAGSTFTLGGTVSRRFPARFWANYWFTWGQGRTVETS